MRILALVAAAGADDDAAQRRLWAWATAQGADVSRIASRHFPGHGRGLAAPACEDGCADLLFFLPPSVLMSCADLVASDSFQLALGITSVDCNAADFDAGFSADNRLNVLGAFLAHEVLRGGRWAPYTDTLGEPTSPAAAARGASGGEARRRRAKAAYHASSYASRRLAAVAGDNLEFASMVAGAFRRGNAAARRRPCRRRALALFTVLNRPMASQVASRPSVRFESGVKRKYKFLSALEQINHDCVYNLKPSSASPGVACSAAYWAIPYASGGGGPVLVSKIDAVGKMEPTEAPQRCVVGHKAAAPLRAQSFDDGLLCTASDDSYVKVFQVAGALEHRYCDVEATTKKIAGTSVDAAVHAVEWSYDGATYLASCRDRTLRLFDARTGAEGWRCEPHGGSRAFTALWGGPGHAVLSAGSAQRGGREVCLLDARKASEGPVFRKLVDAQTGELMPVYDEDSSVLWVWGRGDTSAKHYEVDAPGDAATLLDAGQDWRTASGAGPTAASARCPSPQHGARQRPPSTEKQERDNDDAAMDNLSRLATQYEKFNVNRSMGAGRAPTRRSSTAAVCPTPSGTTSGAPPL
ncbi:hypothetical protein JL721_4081 [Aureococcus anophagefferens]|nr:hypothetical protein JL721_4081 [Aureococcus anophagefferens]